MARTQYVAMVNPVCVRAMLECTPRVIPLQTLLRATYLQFVCTISVQSTIMIRLGAARGIRPPLCNGGCDCGRGAEVAVIEVVVQRWM